MKLVNKVNEHPVGKYNHSVSKLHRVMSKNRGFNPEEALSGPTMDPLDVLDYELVKKEKIKHI